MKKTYVVTIVVCVAILGLMALLPIARRYDERRKLERETAALHAFRQQSYRAVTALYSALEKGSSQEELTRLTKDLVELAKSHFDSLTTEQSNAVRALNVRFQSVAYCWQRITENPTRLAPTPSDLQWLEQTGIATNIGVWVTFDFEQQAAAADRAQAAGKPAGQESHLSPPEAKVAALARTNWNPSFALQAMLGSMRPDLEFLRKEFGQP